MAGCSSASGADEEEYLSELALAGVGGRAAEKLAAGYMLCDKMAAGYTAGEVAAVASDETGPDYGEALVTSIAAAVYVCPDESSL